MSLNDYTELWRGEEMHDCKVYCRALVSSTSFFTSWAGIILTWLEVEGPQMLTGTSGLTSVSFHIFIMDFTFLHHFSLSEWSTILRLVL